MSLKLDNVQNAKARMMARPGGWLQMFAGGDDDEAKLLKEEIKELRKEAASWRTKLREVEGERDTLKAEVTTLTEKVKTTETASTQTINQVRTLLGLDAKADMAAVEAKITELKAAPEGLTKKMEETIKKAAFLTAATGQVINPESAYKLADLSKVKVDLEAMTAFVTDEKGNRLKDKDQKDVAGLGPVVEALLTAEPQFKSKQQSGGSPGSNPANQTQTGEGGLRGALSRLVGGNQS